MEPILEVRCKHKSGVRSEQGLMWLYRHKRKTSRLHLNIPSKHRICETHLWSFWWSYDCTEPIFKRYEKLGLHWRYLTLCTHWDSEMLLFQDGGAVYLDPGVNLPDERQTHPSLLETVVLHIQFCTYLNIVHRFQSKVAKMNLHFIFVFSRIFWQICFMHRCWWKSCLRSKKNYEKYIWWVWNVFIFLAPITTDDYFCTTFKWTNIRNVWIF